MIRLRGGRNTEARRIKDGRNTPANGFVLTQRRKRGWIRACFLTTFAPLRQIVPGQRGRRGCSAEGADGDYLSTIGLN